MVSRSKIKLHIKSEFQESEEIWDQLRSIVKIKVHGVSEFSRTTLASAYILYCLYVATL